MPVYEPNDEILRGSGMRYRVSAPSDHLIALLGDPVSGQFAGQRDGDVVVVWSSGTGDWCVWTNTVDAFRRFQRELTRHAHPNAKLLDRPWALDTQGD